MDISTLHSQFKQDCTSGCHCVARYLRVYTCILYIYIYIYNILTAEIAGIKYNGITEL